MEDLKSKVEAVLDEIRPLLAFHKGNARVIDVEDGVVRLDLEGSCKGCPMSVLTFGLSLRSLLAERVPEIQDVVWE